MAWHGMAWWYGMAVMALRARPCRQEEEETPEELQVLQRPRPAVFAGFSVTPRSLAPTPPANPEPLTSANLVVLLALR